MSNLTRSPARTLSTIGVAALLGAFACLPGFACLAAPSGGEGRIHADEIAGSVTSPRGPEAGVWVIAETDDFKTRFAKIVVTDEAGRYLLPELPPAKYRVWVRGYGLVDSPKVSGVRGRRTGSHPRKRRSGCRHGGEDLSRRVLVRDDEDSRRGGNRETAGRPQRLSHVDEEHGLHRLPSARESCDAYASRVARPFRNLASRPGCGASSPARRAAR